MGAALRQPPAGRFLAAGLFLAFLLVCLPLTARGQGEHLRVARNFLKYLGSSKEIRSLEQVTSRDPSHAVIGYLATLRDGGYVLLSPVRELTPVRAYSLLSAFNSLPPPYRDFLLEEAETQALAVRSPVAGAIRPLSLEENGRRWDFLITFDRDRAPLAYTPDTYLVGTRWDQGRPFNKLLPRVNGEAVVTGCVNTALAQIMKYHRHPASGKGIASYTWNGQTLRAVLYRMYNWDNMPLLVSEGTQDYQADEVAWLMRDLGIANRTDFGVDSSSASFGSALVDYFGYSREIRTMSNADTDVFFAILRSEIDAARPVLLQFPGHMAIADGYGSDPTGRKIHVNMGWRGAFDDFYFLDQPVQEYPTNPGFLSITYGIKPCSGNDCALDREGQDAIGPGAITGVFDDARDVDVYALYLKGPTSLSGTRGYSNLAFHLSLLNEATGAEVFAAMGNELSSPLTGDLVLPAGRYSLRVSLCSPEASCWPTEPGFNNYSLSWTTQAVSGEEKTMLDAGLDLPPAINTVLRDVVLNVSNPDPLRILIDSRDENGEEVQLRVATSNPAAVQAGLEGNVLTLTPSAGAAGKASRITVSASAGQKTTEKSFVAMTSGENIFFGREFEVKGLFEGESALNNHKVVLEGACTIKGFNGYANQAFFSSLQTLGGGTIINPVDEPITSNLGRDVYLLRVSLSENPGGPGIVYPYRPGTNDLYSLVVSCPVANESTAAIADLVGADLSGAGYVAYTVSLDQGWNLISLPVTPANPATSHILRDLTTQLVVAWGYDNEAKYWLRYHPGSQNATLTTIGPGKGYWLLMNSPANLVVEGRQGDPPPIQLREGWNLIGYNGEDGKQAAAVLQDPDIAGKWIVMWGWDNGVWQAKTSLDVLFPEPIAPFQLFERGRGYWIRTKNGAGDLNWSQ